MEHSSKYFTPFDPNLTEEEQDTRAKRQQHAEWGVAVARLGGIDIVPELLQELQRYIDGEVSLEKLILLDHPPGLPTQVYQIVLRREEFAG